MNMYLAEDRMLCLMIFMNIKNNYTLKYFKDCIASVDSQKSLIDLLL